VNGLAWSPDGQLLATAHQDGPIRVWDAETWELVKEFPGHGGWARGVAWSPGVNLLATTGSDGKLVVWDVLSGDRVAELPKRSQPMWSVAWSADGRYLAAGTGMYNSSTTGGNVIIAKAPQEH
jgi:WD40 repeat protein